MARMIPPTIHSNVRSRARVNLYVIIRADCESTRLERLDRILQRVCLSRQWGPHEIDC